MIRGQRDLNKVFYPNSFDKPRLCLILDQHDQVPPRL